MGELSVSPRELFSQNWSKVIKTNINGIDTNVLELEDSQGKYLAIEATNSSLSNICGQFILGHLIYEINYDKYKNRVALIKAYYH